MVSEEETCGAHRFSYCGFVTRCACQLHTRSSHQQNLIHHCCYATTSNQWITLLIRRAGNQRRINTDSRLRYVTLCCLKVPLSTLVLADCVNVSGNLNITLVKPPANDRIVVIEAPCFGNSTFNQVNVTKTYAADSWVHATKKQLTFFFT